MKTSDLIRPNLARPKCRQQKGSEKLRRIPRLIATRAATSTPTSGYYTKNNNPTINDLHFSIVSTETPRPLIRSDSSENSFSSSSTESNPISEREKQRREKEMERLKCFLKVSHVL
jgi:hypothetical protein